MCNPCLHHPFSQAHWQYLRLVCTPAAGPCHCLNSAPSSYPLLQFFPFTLIDAMGTLQETREQITKELR
jgi:hypothetical protein